MDSNTKQPQTGRGIDWQSKAFAKTHSGTNCEVTPPLTGKHWQLPGHSRGLHITSDSDTTVARGPIMHEELNHRELAMITHQPIRTEDPAGFYRMFYKRRSPGLLVIPANKKTSGAFLFCLRTAVRADNHSGLKHSSVCFLYLGKKRLKSDLCTEP